ncbi:hypothetical protein AYJ22_00450 [Ferroacidibacillus organovorans]|nr:hypothetical protein AYJ22_00450 [Ferroacidibacillus organovorans]
MTQSAAREMPIAQESNSVIGVNVLQKFVAKTMPLGREQPGVVVQQSANASLLTHPLKRSGQQAHSLTAALQSDQIQGIEKPSVSSAFIASAQGGGVQAGVKRANHSNVSTSSAESGGALAPGLGVRRTYPSALGLITSAKVHGSSTNQTGAAIASQGVSALQIALQQAKSMKRLPRTVHTGAATMQANMIRLHAILPLRSPQRHGMIAVAMERPSLPHPVTRGAERDEEQAAVRLALKKFPELLRRAEKRVERMKHKGAVERVERNGEVLRHGLLLLGQYLARRGFKHSTVSHVVEQIGSSQGEENEGAWRSDDAEFE